MADNTAPSIQDFNDSGYKQASFVADIQQQANQIKVDDASLRQQAEAQYKPTYEAEQRSLQTQLSALIKAQTDDSDLLNKQYEQSVNTMMAKLAKRGINTGATPDATTAALDKFRNEVMTQRQAAYQTQREGIQRLSDTHAANYELNVQARMATNRSTALSSLNDLMALIAKLQSGSFQDYSNYLLTRMDIDNRQLDLENKKLQLDKQHRGGGGGGRRRGYGSSGVTATDTAASGLGSGYFAGNGTSGSIYYTDSGTPVRAGNGLGGKHVVKLSGDKKNVKIYGGGSGRRLAATK